MIVLVINCGSSSLKYQLINMESEEVLAKGNCERIGINSSFIQHTPVSKKIDKIKIETELKNHDDAVKKMLELLTDKEFGAINSINQINAIGHRVVHGGNKFADSVIITDEVITQIEKCIELAPLHNPANLIGIKVCRQELPNTPMVAVFDTAFHQSMPDYSYTYGISYDMFEKYGIRRYGFHGTSHKYVSNKLAEILNKDIKDLKIITCHLGNGCSICAIDGGKSIDTSMGFTPLEGLIMGSRCGDIDASILTYIMQKENMSIDEINEYLNKKCGVLGVSGVSNDFRDMTVAMNEGNLRAKLAYETFCYKVKKYIGSYIATLNGADAIIFTGGIGERALDVRETICKNLNNIGIILDQNKNNSFFGIEGKISSNDSKIEIWTIPTNEELVIAQDTKKLLV